MFGNHPWHCPSYSFLASLFFSCCRLWSLISSLAFGSANHWSLRDGMKRATSSFCKISVLDQIYCQCRRFISVLDQILHSFQSFTLPYIFFTTFRSNLLNLSLAPSVRVVGSSWLDPFIDMFINTFIDTFNNSWTRVSTVYSTERCMSKSDLHLINSFSYQTIYFLHWKKCKLIDFQYQNIKLMHFFHAEWWLN